MARLADLIADHCDDLFNRWCAEVAKLANYPSPAVLRDHIPQFIERLARDLGSRSGQCVQAPAAIHARQRLKEGFDLRHVIAEYRVLRRCLIDLAHGHDVSHDEFVHANELIDEAISEATDQYSVGRQAALRESEERLLAIVDNAPAIIFLKDSRGRYTLINRRFEDTFGFARQHVYGKTDHQLFPAEMAEVFRRHDEQVIETGAAVEIEAVTPGGDQPRTWLMHKFPLWNIPGSVAAIGAIGTDITERKHLDAMREHFIAVLGHDLRSPLQVIVSALAIAARSSALSSAERGAIASGERQARKMGRMINDLLDFARKRLGGGIPIHRAPLDMAEICREVTQSFAATHPQRQVECHATGDLHGEWDRDRVVQALDNLVKNALDHSSGPVIVSARPEATDSVVVEVLNYGAAIAPDLMPILFEPFHGRGKGGGLGLGLYIVRAIVEAHGATIDVQSGLQTGTRFRIRWPRTAA